MGLLDPGLNFILQQGDAQQPLFDPNASLVDSDTKASPGDFTLEPHAEEMRIVVHFTDDLGPARKAGFRPTTVGGGVAAGFAAKDDIKRIAAAENVLLVEGSRPMLPELDRSVKEVRADRLHAANPPCLGAGVIIGFIESGVDFTHGCFVDKAGRTRISALWDQNLTPQGGERHPKDFDYGVEYTAAMIDEALEELNLGKDPHGKVRHHPLRGHGTHVAGIAAGNGAADGKALDENGLLVADVKPAGTYVGMAPEAEIMIVAYNTDGSMGDSIFAMDAVKYLLDKAGDRPIVINISQGDYFGPHDGTSALEIYIDSRLGGPGKVVVKSAGNAGGQQTHASGTIRPDERIALEMTVLKGDKRQDVIDIWYPGSDRLEVAVKPPNHAPSGGVLPGPSPVTFPLPNQNQVYIESVTGYPYSGDNRIQVRLLPAGLKLIEEGEWEIILTGVEVHDGRFHAWIDTAKKEKETVPKFHGRFANDGCTVSIPGTASKIITVGSYITHIHVENPTAADLDAIENLNGRLAPGSAFGPTRDGRPKPELTAPGQAIISAVGGKNAQEKYCLIGGTSAAAPHVAGAVALLLEKNPKLTCEEVKKILCTCARPVVPVASEDGGWGAGKLDALACHQSL